MCWVIRVCRRIDTTPVAGAKFWSEFTTMLNQDSVS
jgi:hypothetical protein